MMRVAMIWVALACAASVGSAHAQEIEISLQPGETLLEVQSEGVHRARPDVMTISAGVVTTGATAAQALDANNLLATRVVERIRGLGVTPQDLRTTELAVQPRYAETQGHRDDETPRIIGYVASNQVEVRLRDLRRASEVLSAAFAAGANRVEGPRFSLSDDRPAALAAQREGIRLARADAENYAAALAMRVVRILRVSERGRSRDSYGEVMVSGTRVRSTPVEPGEIETRVRVWVDFAMAPR